MNIITTESLLNTMVVLITINSIVSARYRIDEKRLKAAEYGVTYVLMTLLTGGLVMIVWVLLAIETGYWQFAAMIMPPLLITIGSIAARPKDGAKHERR